MAREVQDPTETDRGYETHPAWVLIGASRVQSSGSALFDSDVKHQHYITVKLSRAERKRDLNHDYIHASEEIIEVAMSESQWASFVSSMNLGGGVPATLTWDKTRDDPRVPGVPFEPRLAESMAEVRRASTDAMAKVQEAFETYAAHKTVGNLRTLEYAIKNLPANMEFAAKSLSGHAEDVVNRARADIEAFVVAKATQLGIDPGAIGTTLELSAGPDEGGT